ncbi:Very-short-patch-repair endonuclease [Sphingomonas sp. YR710]|uniref:endonuclease domain-containing protein n=1 Tax=Sphingomonas sp. YR710 TaxID=1882773 RepID=UPI00088C0344|nr:Very-short-patch-repair endonuclease [Sphingomonas sp. YR710]
MPPVRRQISPFATPLRRDMTDVERKLWYALRNRELAGFKFRRQATIGSYVVDFLCAEANLVVELDGGQHDAAADAARTAYIEARGYRVIRFWNIDVNESFNGVLQAIADAAAEGRRRRPSSNLLPQAGEG